MILHRVRLLNYRGVTKSDVSFSDGGVTIVEGPNEVGKTSIHEALQFAIELPDSSRNARIKSVKPVGRDEGPEVEITLSSGMYELVCHKRWLRDPKTTLEVSSPRSESYSGREAHDRLMAILAETLDVDLWRALRIEQGTELTLPHFDLPSMGRALDRAAGGDVVADREDTLWIRIGEEYDKYWTAKGQAKSERTSSERKLKEAQEKVDLLKKQLEDIESDVAQMSRLSDDAIRLSATHDECEKVEHDLTERWNSMENLRSEVERLDAVHRAAEAERQHAASEHQRRQELIDTLESSTKNVAALEARAKQMAPALSSAIRRSEEATAALEAAGVALSSAKDKHSRATGDRDYMRQQIEVEQLTERHDRYVEAVQLLKEAEDYLESARVDDETVERFEMAYLDDERAKAAADSAAASVETTALHDIKVQVDGDDVEMAVGEVNRTSVEDEVVLVVPNIVRMRVSAGPESKGLVNRRRSVQEAYRRLCDEVGVADLAEARRVAQERQEAQRNRTEALKAIERELRDLAPDVLRNKIKNLTRRVTSYPQERPEDPPFPSGFDEAQRIASDALGLVTGCQAEWRTRDDAAKSAEDELHMARLNEAELGARIKVARTSKDEAADRLVAARETQADEALAAALVVAQGKFEGTLKALEEVEAQLRAADPDSLDSLLENARQAKKRSIQELQANSERQNKLRIGLDLRGEKGLHTLYEEAVSQLQHIEREHERVEARAMAAHLLQETFAKRRQLARRRYIEPFKERIDQFGRIVFGPTFAAELDEDLRVVRRALHGTTLNVDQLSTGAREQLGVLSRLACAVIVSPNDGGVPVMIDDALGWSDPQRLQGMGAAIAAAGKQCQVVVLTCTPGRYSHIGNAKVVTLGA